MLKMEYKIYTATPELPVTSLLAVPQFYTFSYEIVP